MSASFVTAPVSALIPVRNGLPYVVEAIEGLRRQTLPLREIVVVDDGSTDGTGQRLRQLSAAEPRLTVVQQPASGLVAALNRGLAVASQPWIARLDADDVAYENRIASQWAVVEQRPEALLVGCAYNFIDAESRPIGVSKRLKMSTPGRFEPLTDPNIPHQGALYLKEAVESLGGYRDLVPAEDLDLWLRLEEEGPLFFVDQALVGVRVLVTGISSSRFTEQRLMWSYVRACARARRSGRPEPDLDQWRSEVRPSKRKIRRWAAEEHLRNAGALLAQRRRAAAVGRVAVAAAKSPATVIYKLRQLRVDRLLE